MPERRPGAAEKPAGRIVRNEPAAPPSTGCVVEQWPRSRVRPYEQNPRKNDEAVNKVATSIAEFGFQQPIVVDEQGVIIAGHTRLKAAERLGLEVVPVIVARGLSPDKARAYRIADNATGEHAKWDIALLTAELNQLASVDYDLDLLGLRETLRSTLELQQDIEEKREAEESLEQREAITQPGDLIRIGRHRLMCGDSGDLAQLEKLIGGNPRQSIDLVFTDPPYNVAVEGRSRSKEGRKKVSQRPIANDKMRPEDYEKLLRQWFGNMKTCLRPGRSFYIWGGFMNLGQYELALRDVGLFRHQVIVWDKGGPVLTRKDYMICYELCTYGWNEGAPHRFFGPASELDLWQEKKLFFGQNIHLTEKPPGLAQRAMANSSQKGEVVLDLFGGSGSTLVAAETVGRQALLMELDPHYCDGIVKRCEALGLKIERPKA